MSQNAEPIDIVGIRTLEEEKRYWRDQAFQSREHFRHVAERLEKAEEELDRLHRARADLDERLSALNDFERAAAKTGYRTPYYLSGVIVECIREETENAKAYTGPRVNDYPSVIGVIGYDVKRQQWTFAPDKNAMIYNGDTVIGQVIGDNGHQVTPTLKGRGRKKRRS